MDLSPQTLREVEFRQALRGYNSDDVDEFLDRVAAGIEILQDRLRQATERALRAEERLAEPVEVDESMKRTLSLAQRTAELAVQDAKEQAARVLAGAESRARDLVALAESDSRRTTQEAQRVLRRELAELERARNGLQADISAFERHLAGERARVRDALTDVTRRLDEHVLQSLPAPVPRPIHVPPEPPDPDSSAPEATDAAPVDPESPQAEPPSLDAGEASQDLGSAGQVAGAGIDDDEPTGDLGDDIEPAGEADHDDDDPFLAELRLAATDTAPLGPRPGDKADESFFDQDHPDDERRSGPFGRRR